MYSFSQFHGCIYVLYIFYMLYLIFMIVVYVISSTIFPKQKEQSIPSIFKLLLALLRPSRKCNYNSRIQNHKAGDLMRTALSWD